MNFDSDNPFEVLNIEPGLGVRDIKRAYVRLIKQYRPESSPKEFEVIRAAYEEATNATEGGYAEAFYGPQGQTALDGGDAGEDAADGDAPIAEPPGEGHEGPENIAEDSALEPGEDGSFEIPQELLQMFRGESAESIGLLEKALEDEDVKLVIATLESEEFVEQCEENDFAQEMATIALTWLVWHDCNAAHKLARRYELASEPLATDSWELIGVEAVRDFEALAQSEEFGEDILAALRAILSGQGHLQNAWRAIERDEAEVARLGDCVAAKYPHLRSAWLDPFRARYEHYTSALETLNDEEHPIVGRELYALAEDVAPAWYARVVDCILLGMCVAVFSVLGFLYFAVARFAWWAFQDKPRYRRSVRPVLIYLALDRGFGNSVVLNWMHRYPKAANGISGFDVRIEADDTLDMLAALHHRVGARSHES